MPPFPGPGGSTVPCGSPAKTDTQCRPAVNTATPATSAAIGLRMAFLLEPSAQVGRGVGGRFHVSGFDLARIEGLRSLSPVLTVTCKLSGLDFMAAWGRWRLADFVPYLDVALDAFGPERVMIGSNWPVCTVSGKYADVVEIVTDYVRRLPERAGRGARRHLRAGPIASRGSYNREGTALKQALTRTWASPVGRARR